jgi:hypothetical protein
MAKPILYRDSGDPAEPAVQWLEWLSHSQIRHIRPALGGVRAERNPRDIPNPISEKKMQSRYIAIVVMGLLLSL